MTTIGQEKWNIMSGSKTLASRSQVRIGSAVYYQCSISGCIPYYSVLKASLVVDSGSDHGKVESIFETVT